jgi:hypothetical protein
MRRLSVSLSLSLTLACSTTPAAPDTATDDAGTDAPRSRDAGTDTGFDAATLGTCSLTRPAPFTIPTHAMLASGDLLQDRDFYVFTVLETLPALGGVPTSTELDAIAATRAMALHDADTASCDPACVRAALVRSDDAPAIDATIAALTSAGTLDDVAAELRASLFFERYVERGDDDPTLVRAALTEAAADAASAIDAYAIGELPAATLATTVREVAGGDPIEAWWQPLVRVATHAMIADGRDEAIRHEPLATTENAAAIAAIATTDFSSYPFVAILVPGQGPTDATTALNPAGAARCDLAVARWQAHLAPFLLLSGGHVHPDRTVYGEAIEMKRYLVTTYAVPESAILVDPYARHTTTNLRNTVRELFAYGAPTDGYVLIVSDRLQSAYIADTVGFGGRCDAELFYRPWLDLQVLSPTDSCMTMAPASLTLAASDPLDP